MNFVAQSSDGRFSYRTYERGVEAETLACGTGAVAIGALLNAWGVVRGPLTLRTRSGKELGIRLSGAGQPTPSLSGEGRIVYRGHFGELPGGEAIKAATADWADLA